MRLKNVVRVAVIGAAFAGLLLPGRSVSADTTTEEPNVLGLFEGEWIWLADGWGEAKACSSNGVTARCYRSEAEMDEAEEARRSASSSSLLAECPSPGLRLYRETGYGGGVLELTTRGVTHNLSAAGFNNDTSSYRVGSCSSRPYDTTTGGGLYPGNTNAGVWASSMASGWDNRVGSAYLS